MRAWRLWDAVEALLQVGKRGNALFVIKKELNAMQLGLLSGLALASSKGATGLSPGLNGTKIRAS
jgi:hypothetical protein